MGLLQLALIDVGRFAVPDVPLREPLPPPGLRSMLMVSGIVGVGLLGVGVFGGIAAFARNYALPLAVAALAVAAAAVLRVRLSRGGRGVQAFRELLAAFGTVAVAATVLLGDLIRSDSRGYLWISGLPRPCTSLGPGHDVGSATFSVLIVPFAVLALLIATRAYNEPILPRRGLVLGVAAVVIWLVTIASDHARFATLIGCAP